MIEINHDIYADGAAIAHGADPTIADLVSPYARSNFKKAFHHTFIAWLFHGNQENRDWATKVVEIVTHGVKHYRSIDEVTAAIEREAKARGYA